MAREHCPFRKTILGGTCNCTLASKTHLPTGCSISCSDDRAWDDCEHVLNEMISAAQFVLQYVDGTDSLTHGKLMKVQHGGLLGLARLVYGEQVSHVDDIRALVNAAQRTYTSLSLIPCAELLTDISGWQLKRRRSKLP